MLPRFLIVFSLGLTGSLFGASIAEIERELELPDFSYAGYHRSERAIPTVTGPVFNIVDYGAEPDDGRSDRTAIEAAMAAAVEQGGGVIWVPVGRFDLAQVSDAAPIVVQHGNLVFRGEDPARSELHLSEALAPPPPMKLYGSPFAIQVEAPRRPSRTIELMKPVQPGAWELHVGAAHELTRGDWIILRLQNADPDFLAAELAGFAVINPRWTRITQDGVQATVRHQVASIDRNIVRLTAPVIKAVDPAKGWSVETWFPIEEIGFEDLTISGNWQDRFVHHRSWQDDGGYSLLRFSNVANAWIRNCRFVDVNRAASIGSSVQVTVLDSTVEGTPGHSAIYFGGSTRCLMARVEDRAGQHHSIGVSKQAIGNVLWRSYWHSDTSFEAHASQPRHTLIDSCIGGFMTGRAGGGVASLPNHLEGLVLWNHHKTNPPLRDFVFEDLESAYWRILQPAIIGMHGTPIEFRAGQSTVLSLGEPIAEGSLYEFQVKRRLGAMPVDLR